MKVLTALVASATDMVSMLFQEPKWWTTDAYQRRTARRNAQLDQVARRV